MGSEGHGSVRANKAILCSNSTFVASFFNNNDQDPNVDIKIPTTLESMKLVIKYWYTGKMEYDSLSLKDTLDLLQLLEFLEEEELFSDIESFLLEKLEEGNFSLEKILLSANVCEDLKFKKITNAMLNNICDLLEDVVKLPEVKYLSSTLLEMVICDKRWIIDDENEEIEDEEVENDKEDSEYELLEYYHIELFKLLVNWLSGNPDCDNNFKAKILINFDLVRFTSDELTTHVRQSSLFSDKDILDALGQKIPILTEKIETLENQKKNFEKKKNDYMVNQLDKFIKFYVDTNRNEPIEFD